MLRYIYIGEKCFSVQTIMNNTGSIVAIVLLMFLLYFRFIKKENKKNVKRFGKYVCLPIIAEVVIAFTAGSFLGSVVRGGFDASKGNLIDNVINSIENSGTHFIGTVLSTAVLLPVICRLVYGRKEKEQVLNCMAYFVPIQHIFNRLGCLSEGCCYGIPDKGFLALKFPDEILAYKVFPSQLFEIVGMAGILFLITRRYKKGKNIFDLSMILFGIWIFISEIFIDKQGGILYFNMTSVQIAAVILICIAIARNIGRQVKDQIDFKKIMK